MTKSKRKTRSSPAKEVAADAQTEATLENDHHCSPAHKVLRTTDSMATTDPALAQYFKKLEQGQDKVLKAIGTLSSEVSDVKAGTEAAFVQVRDGLKALGDRIAGVEKELGMQLTDVKAKVKDIETVCQEHAQALAQLKDMRGVLNERRRVDLVAQIADSKCNGKAEEYLGKALADMGYMGHLTHLNLYSYKTKNVNPKAKFPLPSGSTVWIVEFTVDSTKAASALRMKANASIEAGVFVSLGPNKTKQEREDEAFIRNSQVFRDACKAAGRKGRWDYGKCFLDGEEWTPARVRAAMGGQQQA